MKADLGKAKPWRSAESDLRNAKIFIRVFRDFSIVQTTFCKSLDSSFLDSSFWGKMIQKWGIKKLDAELLFMDISSQDGV